MKQYRITYHAPGGIKGSVTFKALDENEAKEKTKRILAVKCKELGVETIGAVVLPISSN